MDLKLDDKGFDSKGTTKIWYSRLDRPGEWFQNRTAGGNASDWHALLIGLPTLTEIQFLLSHVTTGVEFHRRKMQTVSGKKELVGIINRRWPLLDGLTLERYNATPVCTAKYGWDGRPAYQIANGDPESNPRVSRANLILVGLIIPF